MTPQAWQALWRFCLLGEQCNELRGVSRAMGREAMPLSLLRWVPEYLEQARPFVEHGYNTPAADRLMDEAERYLRYAEFHVIAETKKRADPATYQALRSRLLTLFQTPVPDIGGWGILSEFCEWEKAREALEDGEFGEARRWCELAERKLPEAIRTRQEAWHAAYG